MMHTDSPVNPLTRGTAMLDPLREFDKNILPEEPPAAEAEAGEHLGERAQDLLPDGDQDAPLRTAREPERDTANVAVVFVHGMGTSKPGDMLESYMNPSLEWIKRATTDDNSCTSTTTWIRTCGRWIILER